MIACENAGRSILDQFPEVGKLVDGGVAPREKIDYELSRYACYLIVQNGDPRKEVIALGQTYFAIQTYLLQRRVFSRLKKSKWHALRLKQKKEISC